MNDKKLSVLGIIAAVMVLLAVMQSRINQGIHVADFSSSPLIEGLSIDAVAAITVISDKGQNTITLKRTAAGFVVADEDNYPADASKINDLINNCLDVRTHEKITDNPDNHADLAVTAETARYRVAFLNSQAEEITGMLISESDEKGRAFARLLSANEVYSIQRPPYIQTRGVDYLDALILEVPREQMHSVAVKIDSDEYVLTATEDSSDIKLQDMPDGKQFKGAAYKSVFGVLNSLKLEGVMADENVPEELAFDNRYTCKLKDKTVYRLEIAKKDLEVYAKISANYLGQRPQKEQGVESEEQLKEKEAILLAIDKVDQFNQKHKGWVYKIASYNANNLTMPLADMLEDAPEPEPEQADDAAEVL